MQSNIRGMSRAGSSQRLRRSAAARAMIEALEPRQLLTVDLTGSFVSVPSLVFSGTTQAITLSIANGGTTKASGAVKVELYMEEVGTPFDPNTSRLLTTISPTLSIASGGVQVINVPKLPISAALVAGNYQLYDLIDATNKIVETNESNNTATSAVVVVAQPNYNLVGSFATTTTLPPAIVQGQVSKASVKVLVTNSSGDTATIPAGQKVLVKLVARPVGGPSDGSADTPLTAAPVSVSIGALAPGKSKTLTATVTFPANLSAGSYDLLALVDSGDALAETNEGDNAAVFGSSILVAPAFSDPAVTFDAATVIPASAVSDGRKMPVKIDVKNLGNVKIAAGQTNTINIVLTGGGHTSPVQPFTVNLAGLAPGATKTFTLASVIPAGLLDGAYTVQATLTTTAAGNVTGNDSASSATSVTLGPAFFNLGVAPPTVTTFPPAVINGNPTDGTVSVGIENLSNTLLPAGTKVNIALALRPSGATSSSNDLAIGLMNNVAVGGLALGATKTVKVGAEIPAHLPNGDPITSENYQIVATVTPAASTPLAESTLADNSTTGTTVTVAAPFVDLAIVSATQNFFTPAAANSMAAGTVILRNMGNVTIQGSIVIQFFGTPAGSAVPSRLGSQAFILNLPPGAVSPPLSEALTLTLPNDGLAATPVAVAARIDPIFVDANLGNNQLAAGTVIRSAQFVDLTVSSATNPFSSTVLVNQTGSGLVVVSNIGSGVDTGPVTVSYFAVNGTSQTMLGSQTASIVLGLAQISAPIPVALTIPNTLSFGTVYSVVVKISADATLDNNPDDNVTSSLGTFSLVAF